MARRRGCLGGCLRSFVVLLLILIGLPVYMIYEARTLLTQSSEVQLRDLPEVFNGLTVAFAADIHGGRYRTQKDVARDVDVINGLGADLILLGGDYVANKVGADVWVYEEFARLSAPLGVYAVPGNHDIAEGAADMRAGMAAAGIALLEDEKAEIAKDGQRITLLGADFDRRGRAQFTRLAEGVPMEALCILLAHEPSVLVDLNEAGLSKRIDLSLSGHTHGGQFSLFGLYYGTDIRLLFPNPIDHSLVRGWSDQQGVTHLTSRGVGATIPLRFLSAPEVHLITLIRE